MVSKRLLGVDCDLCVCPSDEGWMQWLKYYNGFGKVVHREDGLLPYNLAEMFPNFKDPYQYWRELDYSQFQPIKGSVEALEKLSQYFGIVFISQAKGSHHKSKYYWLDYYFPFNEGVMLTKEKYLMNSSVVAHIDDRKEHLKGFDFNKRICFNTPYTQSVECDVAIDFSGWDDEIVEIICERYL